MRARCGRCASTRPAARYSDRGLRRSDLTGEGMRALVVEDEAALRESLQARLSAAGFTVDVARDGDEGLFAAREYPLDIAVIDLGLPGLSGLELIRRLRAAGKSYPILILTARDNWQDKV